ncbi:hypothetical protein HAX54_010114 [Datura stramonium]|uniref:Uncharacterized protein n=1 Tax=Datura stramonium TaxID=4076 RepID=A0ABS8TGR6_DATST|nr:hypothetical protein [Datura stramonium]
MKFCPLSSYGNQGVNMVIFDEEYDMQGTIIPVGNTEVLATTSLVAPFITAVPWDYQVESNTKMINTVIAHGMTKSGRCYVLDNLKKPAPGREQNQKRNVTDAEIAEFWNADQGLLSRRTVEKETGQDIHYVLADELGSSLECSS